MEALHAATNERRAKGLCEAVWEQEAVPLSGIVDMHAHYGKLRWFPYENVGGAALVREMDRCGVERIMVSHTPATTTEVRWSNDEVLKAVHAYPGRILGYALAFPLVEASGVKEVERALDAGLQGIKMHNAEEVEYTHPGYEPIWRLAHERALPVLLHTWGDLEYLAPIVERNANAKVLLGHAGAGACRAKGYVDFAKRFPNVWLELCWSRAPYGLIEHLVEEVGAERVVWGSDAPAMSIGQQFGRILFADISDKDKRKILVENPRRVLQGIVD